MSHAEICPICHGEGQIRNPRKISTADEKIQCHGCYGKGWIEIGKDHNPWLYPGYDKPRTIPFIPDKPEELHGKDVKDD